MQGWQKLKPSGTHYRKLFSTVTLFVLNSDSVAAFKSMLKHFSFPRLSLLPLLTNAAWPQNLWSWHYGAIQIFLLLLLFLAHQHKACRQLKIKQEMTAVGIIIIKKSLTCHAVPAQLWRQSWQFATQQTNRHQQNITHSAAINCTWSTTTIRPQC